MPLRQNIVVALLIASAGFIFSTTIPAFAQKTLPDTAQTVMPENKVPGQIESTARRLTTSLQQQGFEALRGYFKLYTTDECDLSYDVMHTCYANNPAAPYVLPVIPPWPARPGPGEWVDPATVGAVGKTVPGYNASYRLDPREAIVVLAQMPPEAAYFGMKTYLFTRSGELCTDSPQYTWISTHLASLFPTFFTLLPKAPTDAPRVEIIADLSNSPNSAVIANESVKVWDQLRYFVITPNPAMDTAVRDALTKIGIEESAIFTEKIPGSFAAGTAGAKCPDATTVHFGLDKQADDFLTVFRYAMPVDIAAAIRWRQQLPMVVLRLRNQTAPLQTYPWTDFELRTPSVPPEKSYSPDLATLTQAVCNTWNAAATQDCTQWKPFLNMQMPPLLLTGPECVSAWMNCLAPNEDTTYQMSPKLPLDPDHFYAVVGPLSTATQNATYVGLGLNSSRKQLGFDNLSDWQLAGSADGYAIGIQSDKLFVQYFARDCTDLGDYLPSGVTFNCYSIGDKLPYCYNASDPQCDMLGLSLRAYIRPGTQRATEKSSVLGAQLILLNKPVPKP